ncbi:hypothetical protein AA313_de0204378 [Arthrobotrys entomopaga]|nr:hypothetical protein AA313_de0204378 [Arthrobotrys entomopaga]
MWKYLGFSVSGGASLNFDCALLDLKLLRLLLLLLFPEKQPARLIDTRLCILTKVEFGSFGISFVCSVCLVLEVSDSFLCRWNNLVWFCIAKERRKVKCRGRVGNIYIIC